MKIFILSNNLIVVLDIISYILIKNLKLTQCQLYRINLHFLTRSEINYKIFPKFRAKAIETNHIYKDEFNQSFLNLSINVIKNLE